MKRICALLLALILAAGLAACRADEEPILQPVNFYYRNAQLTFGSAQGLISQEIADAADYNGETVTVLNAYLRGPADDHFAPTFPAGTQLSSISIFGGTAYLQLSDAFAGLTGLDLTIACACITRTTMELTGATAVCISAESELLDGFPSITMDENSLLLIDNTNVSP